MVYKEIIDFNDGIDPLSCIVTTRDITMMEKGMFTHNNKGFKKIQDDIILDQNGNLYFYGSELKFKVMFLMESKEFQSGHVIEPILIHGYKDIEDIYCYDFTLFLVYKNGTVKSSGYVKKSFFLFEYGEFITHSFPEKIISVIGTTNTYLFLSENGNVYILCNAKDDRKNSYVKMFGIDTLDENNPILVPGIKNIVYMYISQYYVFFIDIDGNIFGGGNNKRRQLVDSDQDFIPLQKLNLYNDIIQVSANSNNFVLFLTKQGKVHIRGTIEQLWIDSNDEIMHLENIIKIGSSETYAVFLTADGTLYYHGLIIDHYHVPRGMHNLSTF